jgi:hypothetical protein
VAGYWFLDVGFWLVDTGCLILDCINQNNTSPCFYKGWAVSRGLFDLMFTAL